MVPAAFSPSSLLKKQVLESRRQRGKLPRNPDVQKMKKGDRGEGAQDSEPGSSDHREKEVLRDQEGSTICMSSVRTKKRVFDEVRD